MRNRIQKSMIFVVTMSLLISYILVTLVIYRQALDIRRSELVQEAEYIRAAIEISGEEYFGTMDKVSKRTRVTWIDKDGKVLYDTGNDQETLANHKSRKEFKEALANGSGQDIRMSDSKGQEMYYYALKMDDSSVLRVSRGMDTVWNTAFMILPYMIAIGVMMACVAWFMTRHQVKRLIAPINNLDLEEPLENDVYEELHPLLERIDRQNKEKAAIEQMRREFSANVSHELKTPIALIQGYAEGLNENISDDPESREFYCEVIMDEASKMNKLVKNLLTLNQLESGKDAPVMERFDIVSLIRGVLGSMHIMIEQKEATVIFEETEPVYVWADEFKIEEVVTNYTSNALNHLDGERKVEIKVLQEEDCVKVTVFNTGTPIPEEDIPNLWNKFYKVDKARTREYGGSGIGLSIVKAIIESMNQKYGVCNYDNGVEFWFTLDCRQ